MSDLSDQQVVTFGLAGRMFAIRVDRVREILDWAEVFPLPQGPECLMGLVDVRGEGVPIIDLRVRLGLPHLAPGPATRVLVVDVPATGDELTLGLMVDCVREVATFPAAAIDAVPDIGVPWRSEYMQAIARDERDGFVVLIDPGRLFSPAETDAIAA